MRERKQVPFLQMTGLDPDGWFTCGRPTGAISDPLGIINSDERRGGGRKFKTLIHRLERILNDKEEEVVFGRRS